MRSPSFSGRLNRRSGRAVTEGGRASYGPGGQVPGTRGDSVNTGSRRFVTISTGPRHRNTPPTGPHPGLTARVHLQGAAPWAS